EFGAVVGARRPIVSMENVNIHKDGRTRILETSGVPIIDAEGRFTGYRGIDRDITDRKRSEEALRRGEADLKEAQNIARLGRWDLDLLNDSLQWSDTIYDIFELDKKKFGATYEAFLDAVHPDDRESVNTAYRDSLNNRQPYTITHRLLMRDGRVKWVHEICRTDYDERCRPVRSVGIVQDITERKIAELELRDKTLQLETLTRNLERRVEQEVALRRSNEQMMVQQSKLAAMGEMLGAIAHQWRQPLNVLGLIIQNLEDAHAHGDLDAAYLEKTVEKSMAQIERMSKTIDDFRSFFLPDKERNVFDTMQAAGHAISLFAAQLSASNIDFQLTCRTHGKNFTRVEDIIPCQEKSVNGFRNEFEHVMMNLLNNAREAIIERRERGGMPERERGRISFEFQNAGGKIFIEVRDNGGGIPEDVIGRVFEPYFTTKDPAKGTGLGLYMSAVIIEEHMQGRLTVKNSGEGAAFTIELPQA
ncbi:MAG TPA: PAS domain-containing protein, partial [Nitrospirota bacterium]